MEQLSFSEIEYRNKKLVTKREKFLNGMGQVVPWERLVKVAEPHYPKMSRKGGRPAIGVLKMLKIYCLQQWYNLSDPAAEEAL